MGRPSRGKSRGRPRTSRKSLRSGGVVDLIDVESDTSSNVIFIDVPESTPKTFRANTAAKKVRRRSNRNVIFIDDDGINENGFHDPSPSMRSCSTSKQPLDETGDDCQFIREKIPPVKLSKCKRTYSGKAPVQNSYGLTSDSECSSSDNDEFMVDCSGKLREQWQKASLKRKNDGSGQSRFRGASSASGESQEHAVETENRRSQYTPTDKGKKCQETPQGFNFVESITTERERMKETPEFKKALEEELASRQRSLAIQAEDAKQQKQLLKRKRAESMRSLEMQERQKQRLEEIRETKKKDEENMDLKEQIRTETQKELKKLELKCHDMPSLLRELGITVGAEASPSSNEVRSAYRKALLKFHPDRASKFDMRQQVEAEEKFKLISRMKDKYLPNL